MIEVRKTAVAVVILAASLAAGCSKGSKPAEGASGAPASRDVATDAARDDANGPVITPDQLPVLKAGLWEETGVKKDGTRDVNKTCHSGKPFKAVQMGKACSKLTIHRTLLGGGFVMDAACGGEGMNMTLHMKAAGDWNSHYTVDTSTTLKLPNQPAQTETEHREARWVGACPAGMEVAE